ncbi:MULTISPECIES: carbohydrate binding domain-containing protein [unclassified Phyllobacterium]|uniref:carbohydrate binding domain-containing protein n=1 Tax=unclassified Phyllobacterium TaxID=2638441 RepID=UPI003012A8DB
MAITFPYDILTDFPGWSVDFDLMWRQEQSRAAGGRTFVKDLGSPLWAATYQSINLKPNDLDYWRARFKLLENGLNQFYGRPKSRCYPIAYPGGNFFGSDSFANLVINPSFEDTTLSPWFPNAGISLGTGTGHTGTKFVVLDKGSAAAGTGTQRETLQVIDGIQAGKQYRMSAWLSSAAGTSAAGAYLSLQWRNAANAVISTSSIVVNSGFGTTWTQVSGNAVAPATATRVLPYIVFATSGSLQTLRVDDVSVARYETFTGLNAQVNSINSNRKAITLKGLNGGYAGKIGDYIQIGSNLHQVMEDFTANSSGVSGEFEIRPHLWPTSAVNDTVSVVRPSCLMTLVPGSFSSTAEMSTGRGSITFQAIESR